MKIFKAAIAAAFVVLGIAPTASALAPNASPVELHTTDPIRAAYQQTSDPSYSISCFTLTNNGGTDLNVSFSEGAAPQTVAPFDLLEIPSDYEQIIVTAADGVTPVEGPTEAGDCTPSPLVSCTQVLNGSAAPFSVSFDDGATKQLLNWLDVVDIPSTATTYQIYDHTGELTNDTAVPTNCPEPPPLSMVDRCGLDNDVLTVGDDPNWRTALIPGDLTPENWQQAVTNDDGPSFWIGQYFPELTSATIVQFYRPHSEDPVTRSGFTSHPRQNDPALVAFRISHVSWTNTPCPEFFVTCTQVINTSKATPFLIAFDGAKPVEVAPNSFINIADVTASTPVKYSITTKTGEVYTRGNVPVGCTPPPTLTMTDSCGPNNDVLTVSLGGHPWKGTAFGGVPQPNPDPATGKVITDGTYTLSTMFPGQTMATIVFIQEPPDVELDFAPVHPRQEGTFDPSSIWMATVTWSDQPCDVPTTSTSMTTTTAASTTSTTLAAIATTTSVATGWLAATGSRATWPLLIIASLVLISGLTITSLSRRPRRT